LSRCHANGASHRLELAETIRTDANIVIEGIIRCSHPECQQEYPIIDGLPILVANIREYLTAYAPLILQREDLGEAVQSILGDGLTAGTAYELNRQYLSSYAWDAYGEFCAEAKFNKAASSSALLSNFSTTQPPHSGRLLDVGCASGRTSFDLATNTDELVLGIDLNFSLIRVAQRALQRGKVEFPLRRVGAIYDQREVTLPFGNPPNLDFWVMDACNLPFSNGLFSGAVALNVLDAVADPTALLQTVSRVLKPDSALWLSSPFEWTEAVTPMDQWLGGHSQRNPNGGSPVAVLKDMLQHARHGLDNLEIVWELDNIDWNVRITERTSTLYKNWLANLIRRP
jgi:SAM-dependent methyltransferase